MNESEEVILKFEALYRQLLISRSYNEPDMDEILWRVKAMTEDAVEQLEYIDAAEDAFNYIQRLWPNDENVELQLVRGLTERALPKLRIILQDYRITTYAKFKETLVSLSELRTIVRVCEKELYTFTPISDENSQETAIRMETALKLLEKAFRVLNYDEQIYKEKMESHKKRLLENVPYELNFKYAIYAINEKFQCYEELRDFLFKIGKSSKTSYEEKAEIHAMVGKSQTLIQNQGYDSFINKIWHQHSGDIQNQQKTSNNPFQNFKFAIPSRGTTTPSYHMHKSAENFKTKSNVEIENNEIMGQQKLITHINEATSSDKDKHSTCKISINQKGDTFFENDKLYDFNGIKSLKFKNKDNKKKSAVKRERVDIIEFAEYFGEELFESGKAKIAFKNLNKAENSKEIVANSYNEVKALKINYKNSNHISEGKNSSHVSSEEEIDENVAQNKLIPPIAYECKREECFSSNEEKDTQIFNNGFQKVIACDQNRNRRSAVRKIEKNNSINANNKILEKAFGLVRIISAWMAIMIAAANDNVTRIGTKQGFDYQGMYRGKVKIKIPSIAFIIHCTETI